ERDDGKLLELDVGAEMGEDLKAVHARQRHVEEDEIGEVGAEAVQRRDAGLVLDDPIPVGEEGMKQEPVVGVVLDDGDGLHAWFKGVPRRPRLSRVYGTGRRSLVSRLAARNDTRFRPSFFDSYSASSAAAIRASGVVASVGTIVATPRLKVALE